MARPTDDDDDATKNDAASKITCPLTADIRVSFEAPLTDGGAAVQAYSVEWDTDPGVQEIQTITT